MICGGKLESTGSQLLNRKRDIYSLSHSLFNFNRVGTLDTQIAVRDSIILWLRKKEMRDGKMHYKTQPLDRDCFLPFYSRALLHYLLLLSCIKKII